MENKFSKHVLLRYSDKLAPSEGTIGAHNEVIKAQGYVWFGKFGRPISQNTVNFLRHQIENAVPSYLFLVQKSGEKYVVTAGELADASTSLSSNELDKVPKYYQDRHKDMGGWFKVKKFYILDSSILEKSLLANRDIEVVESLHQSMAAFFIVRLEKSNLIAKFIMKSI